MSKIKRLADPFDTVLDITPPITADELDLRNEQYHLLEPKKFNRLFQKEVYRPTAFTLNGQVYQIQANHCANPFCKNYGKEQIKYENKKSRYTLSGTDRDKVIMCGKDIRDNEDFPALNCYTRTMSNWSITTEIERLQNINTVLPLEPDYLFHKDTCILESTPFTKPKDFYKRGTSTSNSQRYQCKTCKKFTNVLPDKTRNTTYNQKRNDILPTFAEMLINRVPVSRTCEMLKIGRGTYYSKLEWLYRCCLEFLETRETKTLSKKEFPEMWLNTDKMMYILNNVRKKGESSKSKLTADDKQLPTQVVVTAAESSRYVFRADVCYDWGITKEQIYLDTDIYKNDHLSDFLSKNGKFTKYGTHPMKPSENDTQSMMDYAKERDEYNKRFVYVDGLHINHTYTTIAHLWHIKKLINTPKWRFIVDDDNSLITSFHRAFTDEIASKNAYSFVCSLDKTLSRDEAFKEYIQSIKDLKDWGKLRGFDTKDIGVLAYSYLEEILQTHQFHDTYYTPNGEAYSVYLDNPIEHPLGMKDRGKRTVDCLTDMSHLPTRVLAQFVERVNDNAVNSFLQEIRRSLSILERPLVTSRGDGKSYIYANFNPKYAQMSITILRTYYNFCKTIKTNGVKKTPAQRLGIADKVYMWEDIIYKR